VRAIKFTAFVCFVLVAMQLLYTFSMTGFDLNIYHLGIRPGIFAALAAIVYFAFGGVRRANRKAFNSRIGMIVAVLLLCITFLLMSFHFGAAINYHVVNWYQRGWNAWSIGGVVVFREFIRIRLIQSSKDAERPWVILLLTIVLAFAQLDSFRDIYRGAQHIDPTAYAFSAVFPAITISAVASFKSVEGTFLTVLLFGLFYSFVWRIMPILPYVEPLTWALVVTVLAFVSAIIYYFVMDDRPPARKRRDAMRAKYFEKKPWIMNTATAAVLIALVAFFMGAFPIYPVTILTGSMEGTFNQGSIVFVRRVPEGRAYDMVGEGYIIHFRRNRIEYIHRAVGFEHGEDGRREYLTMGDAPGAIVDPWRTTQDDVLGIAVAQLPFLGWPYVILRFATGL